MSRSKTAFDSRRSVVYGTNAMVVCTQPLATQIGVDILKKGGNAADAAVAMAFTLSLLEPFSTNIGGNALCLFYDAKKRTVKSIDGSGRTSSSLTLQHIFNDPVVQKTGSLDKSILAVTVPGAVAAYIDIVDQFGSGHFDDASILAPSIEMAENGYPVSQVAAYGWDANIKVLQKNNYAKNHDWVIDDCRAPEEGEIVTMPTLAKTYKKIALEGKDGFYKGEIAEAIVKTIQDHGGVMTMEDLANHKTDYSEPILMDYHDMTIWQVPPPSQSVTTLMALGIIEALEENHRVDFSKIEHNSAEYLHIVAEALRIAFADTKYYAADPETNPYPVEMLLNKDYLRERSKLINLEYRNSHILKGYPDCIGNTTSLSVVDKEGNACSLMISVGIGFSHNPGVIGTGIILQDRGSFFSIKENHPNCIAPSKKPFHTLMPAIMTKKTSHGHDLRASFSVMGLVTQNQCQVQYILTMKHYNPSPQRILDLPRMCIKSTQKDKPDLNNVEDLNDYMLLLEGGISERVAAELRSKGHSCQVWEPSLTYMFGRGSMILSKADARTGKRVLAAGCDGRCDGQASGY
ncbi:gamma-glutamyltranspeptidase [Backusella circina FSU 941]|nr:gamma-glutamyltranspeptidase [Backusella circina FSU 941]